MRIVAFDLSLTSTGVALADTADQCDPRTYPIKPGKKLGAERLDHIEKCFLGFLLTKADHVIVEDGLVHSHAAKALGELHGVIKLAAYRNDVALTFVPPTTLKKYATGAGNAKKDLMLAEAVRRFPSYLGSSNDEADALWLLAAGFQLAGQPLFQMPAINCKALEKVTLL